MLPRLAILVLCALSCNVKGDDSKDVYNEDYNYDEDSENKIVGGLVINIKNAPYQVSLERKTKGIYHHICGGSIINKEWVVTAAHCIKGRPKERFRIRAGSTFRQNGGTLHNIANYKMHEKYIKTSHDYDLAVMQVSEPFQFSDKVKPIALASEEPEFGTKSSVSGWGHTSYNGTLSPKLKVVELAITNRGVCSAVYNWQITPRMICAFDTKGGKDSCQGDSGGPLVVDNKLVGIVSWGKGCGQPRVPGVYTNVKVFKIWIEQAIGSSVKIWDAAYHIKLWLAKQKSKRNM